MESAQLALLRTAGATALGPALAREASQLNEILGVREAAKYLRCSPSHVSNILNGKIPNLPPIPHVRAGRLRLIRRESLVRWLDEQETASRKAAQR
jgi:excisionase family DNA binding protein